MIVPPLLTGYVDLRSSWVNYSLTLCPNKPAVDEGGRDNYREDESKCKCICCRPALYRLKLWC